jgi:hypothetical protein
VKQPAKSAEAARIRQAEAAKRSGDMRRESSSRVKIGRASIGGVKRSCAANGEWCGRRAQLY